MTGDFFLVKEEGTDEDEPVRCLHFSAKWWEALSMMCGRDAVGAVSHFRIHFATVHLDWVRPVDFLLKSLILSHTCRNICYPTLRYCRRVWRLALTAWISKTHFGLNNSVKWVGRCPSQIPSLIVMSPHQSSTIKIFQTMGPGLEDRWAWCRTKMFSDAWYSPEAHFMFLHHPARFLCPILINIVQSYQ